MISDIKFYARLFLRRLPLILVIFVVVSGVGLWLAVSLPKVYTSSARLLVEAPQIPTNLAASTVQTSAGEQLEVIRQRLLTRANLIDLARRHGVFADVGQMSPDEIVAQMRRRTNFNSNSRSQATVMTISFDARSGRIAAAVVNDYVTSILDENVRLRTGIAGNTLDFFEQEVERLGVELDNRSAQIVAFQNANINALPEGQSFRQSRLVSLQERLVQIHREIEQIDTQREDLIALFEATGRVSRDGGQMSPAERQLAQAEDELAQAMLVYSATNPRVRILQAQVERLAASLPTTAETDSETGSSALDARLEEIAERKSDLTGQIDAIETEMARLEEAIDATPANAIALEGLRRDYENVLLQYNHARRSLADAATGERIELTSQGQRISVIEQATEPSEPTSPNRKMIAAGGAAAGLGAGLGLVVLLEFLNSAIRRPVELTRSLGIMPLGTIPYITTRAERTRRMVMGFAGGTAAICVVLGALYIFHTQYMPLDLAWAQAQTRLGL